MDSTKRIPDWKVTHAALCAPFPPDEVGQVPIDKSGRLMGSYITARAVMDRLDEVIGPGNWSDEYEVWDGPTCSVLCTLSVCGVSRSDVGYPNDPADAENARREPFKAACSDALKRAAVHWGIGRYLYPKPGVGTRARVSAGSNGHARAGEVEDTEPAPSVTNVTATPSSRGAKPATANQRAAIVKLSRMLAIPQQNCDGLTSEQASERISELSAEYNARRSAPSGRRSA